MVLDSWIMSYFKVVCSDYFDLSYWQKYNINDYGEEMSMIWLVERSAIWMLNFHVTTEKNFEVQLNFNDNTALVVLFEICFWSFFFEVKRSYSQVTTITWDLS